MIVLGLGFWGLIGDKAIPKAFFPTEFMGFWVPCRRKFIFASEFSYNEWHESVELISVLYRHVRYSKVAVNFLFSNRNSFYCFEWLKLRVKSSNFSRKMKFSRSIERRILVGVHLDEPLAICLGCRLELDFSSIPSAWPHSHQHLLHFSYVFDNLFILAVFHF